MRGDQTVLKEVGLSFPLAISSESNEKFVGHAGSKGRTKQELELDLYEQQRAFFVNWPILYCTRIPFFSFLIESLRHWELEWVVGAPSLAAS